VLDRGARVGRQLVAMDNDQPQSVILDLARERVKGELLGVDHVLLRLVRRESRRLADPDVERVTGRGNRRSGRAAGRATGERERCGEAGHAPPGEGPGRHLHYLSRRCGTRVRTASAISTSPTTISRPSNPETLRAQRMIQRQRPNVAVTIRPIAA